MASRVDVSAWSYICLCLLPPALYIRQFGREWLQEDSFKVGTGKSKPQHSVQTTRPRHYLPEHDDGRVGEVEDRFEVAPEAVVDTTVTYGLNLQAPRHAEDPSAGPSDAQPNDSTAARSSQRNGQNGASVTSRDWETKAFKVSGLSLPPSQSSMASPLGMQ